VPLLDRSQDLRTRILEKQNWLQMRQVFSVSPHLSLDGFAFQGFYKP
jgi:hypothetical protein